VALATTVALTATACGRTTPQVDQSGAPAQTSPLNSAGALVTGPTDAPSIEGGTLTYGIEAEPEGLDPTRYDFSQAGNLIASAVFDPLVTLDEHGKAVPYLASSIEPNADFTSWTIVIPTGVKFHDDTPLDASVVAADIDAYRKSLLVGPAMAAWYDSVTATDPTHVVVKMSQPMRIFREALATQIGYVFAPAMLTDTSLAKRPVGTGPFVFDDHTDGVIWSFKKNPHYHVPGKPHLDAIKFEPIPDDGQRLRDLQHGDIDMMQTVGNGESDAVKGTDTKVVESQHGDKAFLMLNTSQPPFDNLTARRAVAYATDSAGWRKQIYGDAASPVNGPFTPGGPGYVEDNGFPSYDPAKAKDQVDQYKRETGHDLTFTFLAASDLTNAAYAQFFLPAFEAAGMKVTIDQKPQINLLALVATGSYQMSEFRLFSNPEPRVDSIFYTSTSIGTISLDFPRWTDAQTDDLVRQDLASGDAKTIEQSQQTISRRLAEQLPFIWLGQTHWLVAANPRVNGLGAAANGTVPTLTPRTWLADLSLSG
jgi:peptide/nickel transport system substrate-binding protein